MSRIDNSLIIKGLSTESYILKVKDNNDNVIFNIDNTYIGIGTEVASAKLHIKGNGTSELLKVVQSDDSEYFTVSNSGYTYTKALNIGYGDNAAAIMNFNSVSGSSFSFFKQGGNLYLSYGGVDKWVYSYDGSLSINTGGSASAMLQIKGADSTSSNYALKIDNSASIPILHIRNDKAIIYGTSNEATRNIFENGLNRLVFGTASEHDTANLYIKQNNTSLPSHYINVVNTSNLNYFSVRNDGKVAIGLQQNYAIPYDATLQILGGDTSSDRLLSVKNNIVNSDLFTVLGSGLVGINGGDGGGGNAKLHVLSGNSDTALFESKATTVAGYSVKAYATTANTQSNIALYANASGGFANLGLWVENGLSCFGSFNPDAKVYIKGIDSTSSNYALKIDNSSNGKLLHIKNNGVFEFDSDLDGSSSGNDNVSFMTRSGGTRLGIYAQTGFNNTIDMYTNNVKTAQIDNGTGFYSTRVQYRYSVRNIVDNKAKLFVDMTSGNVGVGSDYIAPTSQFHITGSDSTSSNYALKIDNSSGTALVYVRNDGNVGIGTSTPSEKLDINGKTKTSELQITTGATLGYILTSDANGNATWTVDSSTKKYSTTLTTPTAGTFTITHSLNTTDISVSLWLVTSGDLTNARVTNRTLNTVDIIFSVDVGENVRVVIIG